MSGTLNQRLLPANITLLQPGSQNFRLSDALHAQAAINGAAQANQSTTAATITTLQSQVTNLESQVTNLESQVTNLESQVTTLQSQVQALQQFQRSFDYQQVEVSTGTYFLDQRTIYKRSFVINGALNTALNVFTFAHTVANINYIVNVQAMAAQAGGQQLPITFINMATAPSISLGVSCWCDTTNIYIACGGVTFTNYQVLATLWYTATDR